LIETLQRLGVEIPLAAPASHKSSTLTQP
jgi:hypothetical protein